MVVRNKNSRLKKMPGWTDTHKNGSRVRELLCTLLSLSPRPFVRCTCMCSAGAIFPRLPSPILVARFRGTQIQHGRLSPLSERGPIQAPALQSRRVPVLVRPLFVCFVDVLLSKVAVMTHSGLSWRSPLLGVEVGVNTVRTL